MFEAYKVGVTLALQNQVSAALGLIAREFIKTDAEAKKLQGTLKEIKLLGMTGMILGGAGFLGLGAIKAAVKPASEYVHQLELAKVAGMSQLEIAKATGSAWQATGKVMTTTASENLAAIRELRMVFGDTEHAIEHMATVQRLQAVLQTVRGGSAHDEAYTVAKALEMKGAVKNPAEFEAAADLMTKAIIASGGKVAAADFLSTFKYGRAATIGWDDRFTYSILPTLIQEMKSSGGTGGAGGPGNALMSAYAAVVGGAVPQKALKVWQSLGLLDSSKIVWNKVGSAKGLRPGGIMGSETFQSDPYRWTQQFLVPALVKAGYDTEAKQRQVLQYLFPNRTAGFIMSQMALQGWKFDRDQKIIGQASGLSAYDELIRRDPVMAEKALGAQWENFKIALGKTIVPVLIPLLRSLTDALNGLATFTARHPTLTQGLMLTFTALSALATVGGGLLVGAAGLKLAGVALTTLTGLPLASAAAGLGTLVGVIGSIVALGMAIANADKIGAMKYSPGNLIVEGGKAIGGGLRAGWDWMTGDDWRGSYGPPPSGKPVQVQTQVNLDGRQIARVVTHHQTNDASRAPASGSGFDGRQSYVPSGMSGAW